MICRTDISSLKTDITDKIGQKIIVKGSLGRSKEFEKEGTIEKVYSNLFVVKYEENNRTASYTYTDLLTRTIELDVFGIRSKSAWCESFCRNSSSVGTSSLEKSL